MSPSTQKALRIIEDALAPEDDAAFRVAKAILQALDVVDEELDPERAACIAATATASWLSESNRIFMDALTDDLATGIAVMEHINKRLAVAGKLLSLSKNLRAMVSTKTGALS